jgi:hypothetical protein
VTAVERDLVSWFRVDGDFPVILTVGFKPHSADGRAILVKHFENLAHISIMPDTVGRGRSRKRRLNLLTYFNFKRNISTFFNGKNLFIKMESKQGLATLQ